ncbi:MAG: DUF2726 domain-containing protein [Clostridia bacterium]|nr:DUF2726 domain-containing protein [Clostridia bacterium]MDD4376049.1 DUF2726 domain-containing protein [Clostridia bacterium]
MGRKNKTLLTKNEQSFFSKLNKICNRYNLYVFPKIRIADIISTNNMTDFNKIKSKHIDFTVVNILYEPLLFIELDDKSHNNSKNKENDIKKDYIFKAINENILRVKINEVSEKLLFIENIIMNKTRTES